MEKYSLTAEGVSPLMAEWLEFESNSFQGFLLTLNLEEIESLYEESIVDKGARWAFVMDKEHSTQSYTAEEISVFMRIFIAALVLILTVKRGYATYTQAEDENDWNYNIKDEYKEELAKLMLPFA